MEFMFSHLAFVIIVLETFQLTISIMLAYGVVK